MVPGRALPLDADARRRIELRSNRTLLKAQVRAAGLASSANEALLPSSIASIPHSPTLQQWRDELVQMMQSNGAEEAILPGVATPQAKKHRRTLRRKQLRRAQGLIVSGSANAKTEKKLKNFMAGPREPEVDPSAEMKRTSQERFDRGLHSSSNLGGSDPTDALWTSHMTSVLARPLTAEFMVSSGNISGAPHLDAATYVEAAQQPKVERALLLGRPRMREQQPPASRYDREETFSLQPEILRDFPYSESAHNLARKIQALVRSHAARKRSSAIRIQSTFRGFLVWRFIVRKNRRRAAAATCLQALVRGIAGRRYANWLRFAPWFQRILRGFLGRCRAAARRHWLQILRRGVDSHMNHVCAEVAARLLRRVLAQIVIACAWRGRAARKLVSSMRLQRRHRAAITIQTLIRGVLARKRVQDERERRAATLLQSAVRAVLARLFYPRHRAHRLDMERQRAAEERKFLKMAAIAAQRQLLRYVRWTLRGRRYFKRIRRRYARTLRGWRLSLSRMKPGPDRDLWLATRVVWSHTGGDGQLGARSLGYAMADLCSRFRSSQIPYSGLPHLPHHVLAWYEENELLGDPSFTCFPGSSCCISTGRQLRRSRRLVRRFVRQKIGQDITSLTRRRILAEASRHAMNDARIQFRVESPALFSCPHCGDPFVLYRQFLGHTESCQVRVFSRSALTPPEDFHTPTSSATEGSDSGDVAAAVSLANKSISEMSLQSLEAAVFHSSKRTHVDMINQRLAQHLRRCRKELDRRESALHRRGDPKGHKKHRIHALRAHLRCRELAWRLGGTTTLSEAMVRSMAGALWGSVDDMRCQMLCHILGSGKAGGDIPFDRVVEWWVAEEVENFSLVPPSKKPGVVLPHFSGARIKSRMRRLPLSRCVVRALQDFSATANPTQTDGEKDSEVHPLVHGCVEELVDQVVQHVVPAPGVPPPRRLPWEAFGESKDNPYHHDLEAVTIGRRHATQKHPKWVLLHELGYTLEQCIAALQASGGDVPTAERWLAELPPESLARLQETSLRQLPPRSRTSKRKHERIKDAVVTERLPSSSTVPHNCASRLRMCAPRRNVEWQVRRCLHDIIVEIERQQPPLQEAPQSPQVDPLAELEDLCRLDAVGVIGSRMLLRLVS